LGAREDRVIGMALPGLDTAPRVPAPCTEADTWAPAPFSLSEKIRRSCRKSYESPNECEAVL